jgi:hypothetical protein
LQGNSMHAFKAGEIYVLGANLPHLFKSNPEYFDDEVALMINAVTIFLTRWGSYPLCLICRR